MPLRILLVEDSPDLLGALARLLQRSFPIADIRTAEGNDQAYGILREFAPDLIVTDLNRPGGSGTDFIAALRRDPYTAKTRIILMSGNPPMSPWRDQALAAGADSFLQKPFAPRDLLEEIRRLLHTPQNSDEILIQLGYESRELDYKSALDLATKVGRAALAKDVIAMANWGGGNIIVGIDEIRPGEFLPSGIPEEQLGQYEVSRLNRAIRDYLDPPVAVIVRRTRWNNMHFVILQVPAAHESLVLAAKKHDQAGLFMGRIYTRTSAAESAEVQHSAELRQLLARLSAQA